MDTDNKDIQNDIPIAEYNNDPELLNNDAFADFIQTEENSIHSIPSEFMHSNSIISDKTDERYVIYIYF